MFPLELSLFDIGLLITIAIFMLLYLIVLIKLKPSTRGQKTLKMTQKQDTGQFFSTIQRNNPEKHHENREEPAEKVKAIQSPESASTVSVETKKTDFSPDTQTQGCPYHFGYLKEHPKNTPLPNECLTCTKIMECLEREE